MFFFVKMITNVIIRGNKMSLKDVVDSTANSLATIAGLATCLKLICHARLNQHAKNNLPGFL